MDYSELIHKYTDEKNWDQVLLLANKAKLNDHQESYFGIRKGYVNLFEGWCSSVLTELGKIEGILYQTIGNQPRLNKIIKKGTFSKELVANNFFISDYDVSSAVIKKLEDLEYPYLRFRVGHPKKGWKITVVKNLTTGEEFEFENIGQLLGMERERKINSILD
jgi:hypothetical protein